VVITYFPERLLTYVNTKADARGSAAASSDEQKRRDLLRRLVEERGVLLKRLVEERGLRGQLRSGSLVTGQLYVSFDYYPNAPKAKIDLRAEEPELPVVSSTLVELEDKVTHIVDKIDKMPLEAIGSGIKKDLESLDQTLMVASKLISNADAQLVPGLKTAVEDLHSTLVAIERATNNANATLLESNAAAQEDLRNALYEFTQAARSLRVLTDALERQPSSLIRGKTEPSGGK
jgi:paraquat-inducible protein B